MSTFTATAKRLSTADSMTPTPQKEMSPVDVIRVLTKYKIILFAIPVLFGLSASLITKTMPNIYLANAKILPREQPQTDVAAVLNQLNSVNGALSIQIPIDPNAKISNDLYISLLKSRSIADSLVLNLDLKTAYGAPTNEIARKILTTSSKISLEKGGIISIDVEDANPNRAASIANAYADELLKLVKRLGLTNASQRRTHIERHLQAYKEKLNEARTNLSHGSNNGAAHSNEELSASLDAVAQLRAQIFAKEIELGTIRAFAKPGDQEYGAAQQELINLKNQLAKHSSHIESDTATSRQQNTNSKNALYNVRYYEKLTELLSKQTETAHLTEAQDASILQVLDKAVEPETPVKPKRGIIVASAIFFGFFIAAFGIVIFDMMRTLRRQG